MSKKARKEDKASEEMLVVSQKLMAQHSFSFNFSLEKTVLVHMH